MQCLETENSLRSIVLSVQLVRQGRVDVSQKIIVVFHVTSVIFEFVSTIRINCHFKIRNYGWNYSSYDSSDDTLNDIEPRMTRQDNIYTNINTGNNCGYTSQARCESTNKIIFFVKRHPSVNYLLLLFVA